MGILKHVIPALAVMYLMSACAAPAPHVDTAETSMEDRPQFPVGKRIAANAEGFLGTPYDPDPLGAYVSSREIVADSQVDCMYLVFRSVELAFAGTPQEAVQVALRKRFMTRGVLGPDGKVENYDERFQYAMDMLASGKWGIDVTAELGARTSQIEGARGHERVVIIPSAEVATALGKIRSGDIIYLIKHPEKRVVGEIVGHLGIALKEGGQVYMVHASGSKNDTGGGVVKVLLGEYAAWMPFAGIKAGRFKDEQKGMSR